MYGYPEEKIIPQTAKEKYVSSAAMSILLDDRIKIDEVELVKLRYQIPNLYIYGWVLAPDRWNLSGRFVTDEKVDPEVPHDIVIIGIDECGKKQRKLVKGIYICSYADKLFDFAAESFSLWTPLEGVEPSSLSSLH